MSTHELCDLPHEIVARILLQLDIFNIHRCRQVCGFLRDLIDNEASIRYRCELDVTGMEDGPPGPLGASQRLAALQSYQQAWRKLKWKDKSSVPMAGGHAWELLGNTLVQIRNDKQTLVFNQIPSAIRGVPGKSWEVHLDFVVRDFAVDPAQDLLVAVCECVSSPTISHTIPTHLRSSETTGDNETAACTIHFRSMETGLPHPRAPKAPIHDEAPERVVRAYTVQICGERLGVLFHQDDEQHLLRVWEWQRGACVFEHRTHDETSFAFLTPTHVLVASVQEPDSDDRPVPLLEVFDVSNGTRAAPGQPPTPLTFHLPRFLSGLEIVHICVRSDPSPAACSTAPFGIAPTSRLFVISLWVSVRDMQPQPLVIFIPLYTFLPFLQDFTPRNVPWLEWGPPGTRISHSIFTSSVWVCYVHGMRFITRGHAVRDEGEDRYLETWLHVYEFTPLELRRDPTDVIGEARAVRASRMAMFEDPVTTALPFRRVSKLLTRTANGEDLVRKRFYPMLAEDAIVLVHDGEQQDYTLLAF